MMLALRLGKTPDEIRSMTVADSVYLKTFIRLTEEERTRE